MVIEVVGVRERDERRGLAESKLGARDGDKASRESPDGIGCSNTDGVEINALLNGAVIIITVVIGEIIIVLINVSSSGRDAKINIEKSKFKVLITEIETVNLELFSRRTVCVASRDHEGGDILNGEVDTLVLKLVLKIRAMARSVVAVVGVDGEMIKGADVVSQSISFIRVSTISPAAGC